MQHAVGQLANNLLFSVGRQVAIAVKDATCKQEVKFMKASGVALQARNGPHRLLECKQLGQHSKLPPNNANAGSMRCGGAQYVAIAGHSKGRALAAHAMGSSECEQNCAPPSSTPRPRPRQAAALTPLACQQLLPRSAGLCILACVDFQLWRASDVVEVAAPLAGWGACLGLPFVAWL